jgi:hypothetical protein
VLVNSVFATTVAVAVPVILLALGAEARGLDERTRPQRNYSQLIAKRFAEAEQVLESFPDASPDWTPMQTRTQWASYQRWVRSSPIDFVPPAYLATILWALTITSLSVVEVWTLVWLGGPHPDAGDSPALAWLSVIACALGVILLLAIPTLRLLWIQFPSTSNLELPDSFMQLVERKFGLSANATNEERRRWLHDMNDDLQ